MAACMMNEIMCSMPQSLQGESYYWQAMHMCWQWPSRWPPCLHLNLDELQMRQLL